MYLRTHLGMKYPTRGIIGANSTIVSCDVSVVKNLQRNDKHSAFLEKKMIFSLWTLKTL
jgi:hypothetical protein